MSEGCPPDLPVPFGRAKSVKTAVLQVIPLAHYTILSAHGWTANARALAPDGPGKMDRLSADLG